MQSYRMLLALELAEGVNFRGRGVRLGRWEGGWRIRLGKCPETRDELCPETRDELKGL